MDHFLREDHRRGGCDQDRRQGGRLIASEPDAFTRSGPILHPGIFPAAFGEMEGNNLTTKALAPYACQKNLMSPNGKKYHFI